MIARLTTLAEVKRALLDAAEDAASEPLAAPTGTAKVDLAARAACLCSAAALRSVADRIDVQPVDAGAER